MGWLVLYTQRLERVQEDQVKNLWSPWRACVWSNIRVGIECGSCQRRGVKRFCEEAAYEADVNHMCKHLRPAQIEMFGAHEKGLGSVKKR